MYSLYRAWLSLGPSPSAPPQPVLQDGASGPSNPVVATRSEGAPDVSLQVGPTMTQFSAHRTILSANSGFFKAVLLNHTGKGWTTRFKYRNLVNLNDFTDIN